MKTINKKTDIEKLEAIANLIDFDWQDHELGDDNLHDQYDMMLNECSERPTVGCCSQDPAEFLKQNDPIGYRCGFCDWLDSERDRIFEIAGIYIDEARLDDAKEEIADIIQSLN